MSAVQKHNLGQINSRSGAMDRSAVTHFVKPRQSTDMINMSVGNQHKINFLGIKKKFLVLLTDFFAISALKKTAIKQDFITIDLYNMPGAGDILGRSTKF